MHLPAIAARHSAHYSATVAEFLATRPNEILGTLSLHSRGSIEEAQRSAWATEIDLLKPALAGLSGTMLLEFDVPRIGSRIDMVLISGPVILPIEFKVGETEHRRQDIYQAWDYALDLKNFHSGSHSAPIVPILVATEATHSDIVLPQPHADGVSRPTLCGRKDSVASSTWPSSAATGHRLMVRPGLEVPTDPRPRSSRLPRRCTLAILLKQSPATKQECEISTRLPNGSNG